MRDLLQYGATVFEADPFFPRAKADQKSLIDRCQGIDAVHLSEQYPMTKRAALGGHETALAMYLSGSAFRSEGAANLPFLDDWRQESPRIFEAAMRNGSMTALLAALQNEFGSPSIFLPVQDPFEQEAQRLVLLFATQNLPSEFGAPDLAQGLASLRTRTLLSNSEFDRAESLARTRAAAWYGDKRRLETFAEHWQLKAEMAHRDAVHDANLVCQTGYLPPLVSQDRGEVP
ncbi:MAG: hypothetical protein IPK97_14905 [Ahniella sp.]|nr:hypothetical protein [Ahniella sp.]